MTYAPQTADAALCEGCPPVGYPTDKTRCQPCPRGNVPTQPSKQDKDHSDAAKMPNGDAAKMCASCKRRVPASYRCETGCYFDDTETSYDSACGAVVTKPYSAAGESFQARVHLWMLACFGPEIASDRKERNHRFFEESTELVQAGGMTRSEAHQLVDYTYDRPTGAMPQEVGGVMVTLAALCLANDLNMHQGAETELTRINQMEMIEKIRAKQAAKPKHLPLPEGPQPKGGDADCPAKITQSCDMAPSRMPTDGAVGWQPIETAPRDGTHILAALRREACRDMDGIWRPIFIELREIWFRNHVELGLNLPWHAGDPFDSYDGMPDTHMGEHVPIRWIPLPQSPGEALALQQDEVAPQDGKITVHPASYDMGIRDGVENPDKAKRYLSGQIAREQIIDDAIDFLKSGRSGFIPGSISDEEWDKQRDYHIQDLIKVRDTRDYVGRLRDLVQCLIDNDPDGPIADGGHVVLDLWRQQARELLQRIDEEARS